MSDLKWLEEIEDVVASGGPMTANEQETLVKALRVAVRSLNDIALFHGVATIKIAIGEAKEALAEIERMGRDGE